MHAALLIAAKDLRQRVRDRSAIVVAVIAPFALAAIFGMLIRDGGTEFTAHYAIIDDDGGPIAAAFIDGPMAALADPETGVAEIVDVASEAEAREQVDAGELDAVILIPAGFSDAVLAGGGAKLAIIGNTDSTLGTEVARAVSSAFMDELAAIRLSVAAVLEAQGRTPDPAYAAELAERAQQSATPVTLAGTLADSRQMGATTFYAASMAIFFLFFTAQFGALSLLGERRGGTLPRLVAAPIPPWAIVAGKALGSFVLAAVAMAVLVASSTVLLGATWGDPLAVATLVLGAVVAAMGITALITTLSRTEEQAGNLNSIAAVSLAILGGAFFPLGRGPDILQQVSLLTPHAWFLRGISDLGPAGTGIGTVLLPIAALFVIGLGTGAIGLARAGRLVVAR
ncbi:MAG: ABC transporter permease [Chloroflexota bacterium]|nr:ABC transporter permease [Chloroflexota bacterium]